MFGQKSFQDVRKVRIELALHTYQRVVKSVLILDCINEIKKNLQCWRQIGKSKKLKGNVWPKEETRNHEPLQL